MPNDYNDLFQNVFRPVDKQNPQSIVDNVDNIVTNDKNHNKNDKNLTNDYNKDYANFRKFFEYYLSRYSNYSKLLPVGNSDDVKMRNSGYSYSSVPSNISGGHSENSIYSSSQYVNTTCFGVEILNRNCYSFKIFLLVAIISTVFLVFFIYFSFKIMSIVCLKKKKETNNSIPFCTLLDERRYKSEPVISSSQFKNKNNNFFQDIKYTSMEHKVELNL